MHWEDVTLFCTGSLCAGDTRIMIILEPKKSRGSCFSSCSLFRVKQDNFQMLGTSKWVHNTWPHIRATTLLCRPTLTDSNLVPWVRWWRRQSWEDTWISGPVTTETLLVIGSVAQEANDDCSAGNVGDGRRGEATESTCMAGKKFVFSFFSFSRK